ncbi:DarT ssDNA thymidine ADP-ribosyltransferase family protein [Burkholderia perseverans]|uniref:DarT ssDNA thymidine ADP-ribosyltransferase family protein n=1 Tax=Burkholderia perseverans TaxID=2615214 RepID=UPI003CC7DF66
MHVRATSPRDGGRSFKRQASHLSCSPTDMQAEVLVPGPIPIDAIQGMAMRTEKQAQTERARALGHAGSVSADSADCHCSRLVR